MAYEQTTTRSLGQRLAGLGEGIANAGKGVMESMGWAQRRKHTEMQMQGLQQQMDAKKQEMQQAAAQGMDQGLIQQNDMDLTAMSSDNPGDAAKALYGRHAAWGQMTGNSYPTPESYADHIKVVSSAVGDAPKILRNSLTTVGNVGLAEEANARAYKQGLDSLATMKPYIDPKSAAALEKQLNDARSEYTKFHTLASMGSLKETNKSSDELTKEARKELTNAENVITGVATRGTASMFGQSAKRAFGGRLLDNMLDKIDNPQVPDNEKLVATKQVAMTFARNFDAAISQGGSSAEFAQHMVPPSWQGSAADFWQKVKGDPEQYLTPEFLRNFANEIKVERDTVSSDMGQMISAKYDALARNYGQEYADRFKQTAQERFKNDTFVTRALNSVFSAKRGQPSGQQLGPDEEVVNGYVVNHKTKQVLRKAQ